MDKITRNILIGTGVIAVGGAIYLIFFGNNKKGKGGGTNLFTKGKKFGMGYIQNGYIHVTGDDRAEATKYLKVGTKITMSKANDDINGDKTIKAIWKDVNGNIGAFKTQEFSVGYNTSQNREFEDKGEIFVKTDD